MGNIWVMWVITLNQLQSSSVIRNRQERLSALGIFFLFPEPSAREADLVSLAVERGFLLVHQPRMFPLQVFGLVQQSWISHTLPT